MPESFIFRNRQANLPDPQFSKELLNDETLVAQKRGTP
jgi:hypothetical protein